MYYDTKQHNILAYRKNLLPSHLTIVIVAVMVILYIMILIFCLIALESAKPRTVAMPNKETAWAMFLISRLKPYNGELDDLRILAVNIGSLSTTCTKSERELFLSTQMRWIFNTVSSSGGRALIFFKIFSSITDPA